MSSKLKNVVTFVKITICFLLSRPFGSIIMVDGTAIHLFDENDNSGVREKVHQSGSRERQDEVGNSDQ